MKLYILNGSPNCRKVVAVINHLGLDVDMQSVAPFSDEMEGPEYLAINPNGMAPALVDGDFKLWESNAIMQYLASTAPDNDLFPNDPKARADITRWQTWEQAHFGPAMADIVWENFVKPTFKLGEPDPTIIERGTENFHRFAPILEQQLASRSFVTGDTLTLADYSLGALLMYAEPGKVPLEHYPNIRAWYQRLEATPAYVQSAPPPFAV